MADGDRFSARLRGIVAAAAAISALSGSSGLIGWLFGIERLLSLTGDTPALVPLTSATLIIAGAALWRAPDRPAQARAIGAIVVAIAVLAALGYLTGTSFRIGDLPADLPRGAGTLPGLPAPNSTVAFALIGAALVSLGRPRAAHTYALVAAGIAYLAMLGELFGASTTQGVSSYTAMSPQTAIGIIALSTGVVCASTSGGLMPLLLDGGSAGLAVRRFMPVAFLLPVLLGGIRVVGEEAALFDTRFGTALMAFAAAVLAGVVTIDIAVAIRDLEQRFGREHSARAIAESESRVKDDVLALLTEELRTPANTIYAQTHLLQAGVVTPQRMQEVTETLSKNATRLRQAVDDAVEVSSLAQGGALHQTLDLDPREPFRAGLDRWAPQIAEKGITLVAQLVPAGVVHGDARRLERIASNLVSNAVKFTPAGGRIQVQTTRDGDFVRLTVSDDGVGIDRDFLPYVFDPFRRSSSLAEGHVGGLGLGLAIVRHLVELHGGTVEAMSDGAGTGATFVVRLPAVTTHT